METDFQARYTAAIVAEEKVRDSHREQVTLTSTISVARIIHGLAKLFH